MANPQVTESDLAEALRNARATRNRCVDPSERDQLTNLIDQLTEALLERIP